MPKPNQTTPELDAIMKDSLRQFELPPEGGGADKPAGAPPGPGKTPDPLPALPDPKDNPVTDINDQPDKKTETDATSASSQPDPDPGPAAPRFSSHEEAEKGYRNLQQVATKAAQENSSLKSKLSELQKETSAKKAAETAKETEKAAREYAKQQTLSALKKIEELDPDTDGYTEKVAEIQSDMHFNISNFRLNPPPAPPAETPVRTDPPAAQSHPSPEKPDIDARTYIDTALSGSGIQPQDHTVFYGFAAQAEKTDETGAPLSFQDQVATAIKKTQEYIAAQKTRMLQDIGAPLARGGIKPSAPSSPEKPVSLADAINRNAEARRL